jgi:hypothetical protein
MFPGKFKKASKKRAEEERIYRAPITIVVSAWLRAVD